MYHCGEELDKTHVRIQVGSLFFKEGEFNGMVVHMRLCGGAVMA